MYRLIINSADLHPYLTGEKETPTLDPTALDPTALDPIVAAHLATLRDWRALHTATHPPAHTFADLDPRSQAIYQAIAAAFPGHAIYATGSRVRGAWRSGHPDDPKTAIARRLRKPLESDVDVVAEDVSKEKFRQRVTPIALTFGVQIDRQPPSAHPRIAIPTIGSKP
jgi:hypothetical protein